MEKSALESLISSVKNNVAKQPGYENMRQWGKTFGVNLPQTYRSPVPENAPPAQNLRGPVQGGKLLGLRGIAADRANPYGNLKTNPEHTMSPERDYEQNFNRPLGPFKPQNKIKVAPAKKRIPIKQVKKPTATPTPAPGSFEEIAFPIFDKYNIPRSVGMGMYAAEGRGQGLGADRNNFYNIAAFDSNPDAAFRYDTPEEGIEAFARFISGQYDRYASPQHQQRFANAYGLRDDPVAFVRALEQAGYAGDPKTYAQRANNNFDSYADFIMATPEWRSHY